MGLLFMLATSSLTVNFAQAETSEYEFQISEKNQNDVQVKTIFSEQIVAGKLEMRFLGLLGDLSNREIQEILSEEGVTTGWTYLEGKPYKSGIILYNGKSLKIEEFLESNANKELDDLAYQIIFSAKNSKNAERKFAVIVIDTEPKNPQQNLRLNLFSQI